MPEAPRSAGARIRDRYLRSKISGFTRFVFGVSLLTMSIGFAMGVRDAVSRPSPEPGGSPVETPDEANPDESASAKPQPGPTEKDQSPTPRDVPDPSPEDDDKTNPPAVANEDSGTDTPDDETPPPPPDIGDVDDPAPVPPPPKIADDDTPPRPVAGDTSSEDNDGPMFEVPGINDNEPPPLVKKGDALQDECLEHFKTYRKTSRKSDITKSIRAIEQAISCYRKAKKQNPDDARVMKKLKEANALKNGLMKHAPLF